MSTSTWTQYISMDDGMPEPDLLRTAMESLGDWDDEFEIGDPCDAGPVEELEDPE